LRSKETNFVVNNSHHIFPKQTFIVPLFILTLMIVIDLNNVICGDFIEFNFWMRTISKYLLGKYFFPFPFHQVSLLIHNIHQWLKCESIVWVKWILSMFCTSLGINFCFEWLTEELGLNLISNYDTYDRFFDVYVALVNSCFEKYYFLL